MSWRCQSPILELVGGLVGGLCNLRARRKRGPSCWNKVGIEFVKYLSRFKRSGSPEVRCKTKEMAAAVAV